MKSLKEFHSRTIKVLLTDIDGTLTDDGKLPAHAYQSLSRLALAGIAVIPVTGRPAGWCELIARLWPVHGVVGENGAFYFRLANGKMKRVFARDKKSRQADRAKLRAIRRQVLSEVPGAGIASDQFSRLFDLAIDFREDVPPLSKSKIDRIVGIFAEHGATAKVSNIHVNGWFGDHDKLSTCRVYLKREFGMDEKRMREECAFVGDSPNDEPMFGFFPNAVAVANINEFLPRLKHKPAFIADGREADGFTEFAETLLRFQSR